MPIKNVLVRSTNWIGDAIMTTPALNLLKKALPSAQIKVLARPWVKDIFTDNPVVDQVVPLEGNTLVDKLSTAKRVRAMGFDLTVLFPNSFDSALVAWLSGIGIRAGYVTDARRLLLNLPVEVPKDHKDRHQVFYYMKLVEEISWRLKEKGARPVSIGDHEAKLFLRISPEEAKWADDWLKSQGITAATGPLVGINPGAAYGPAKCWPAEKYKALSSRMLNLYSGARFFVFGTVKEHEIGEKIVKGLGGAGINLAGKTTLGQVMALISRLDLLITNDSGLMHVGAALGTNLVAIFGSTNPVTTGPWTKRAIVVRKELACSPCLNRMCPKGSFLCMESIEVSDVFDACVRMLAL